MTEPSQLFPAVLSPGAYLALRRAAAGLSVDDVARQLAMLPWALVPATPAAVALLAARLRDAEGGGAPFTAPQAALIRNVFRFDLDVYLALIDLAAAGPGSGLPVPQICTGCGCTWHDACETEEGPCAWTADPHRCTARSPAPATAGDGL